ncbi:unnamed protein product [Staurois parvus]|uniref:Uncharacterized protein n=1 Tax=Staurois parvus TaxID=386267 RepID=A0ABN9EFY6_9NEOB|nr:unnamed protein product [Staurois parvus]
MRRCPGGSLQHLPCPSFPRCVPCSVPPAISSGRCRHPASVFWSP